MADEWQVGDLALCLSDEWQHLTVPHPVKGGIYAVTQIAHHASVGAVLGLDRCRPDDGFAGFCFRRIAPLSDAEHRAALEEMRVPEVVEA